MVSHLMQDTSLGESYVSTEIQSVSSPLIANWANLISYSSVHPLQKTTTNKHKKQLTLNGNTT